MPPWRYWGALSLSQVIKCDRSLCEDVESVREIDWNFPGVKADRPPLKSEGIHIFQQIIYCKVSEQIETSLMYGMSKLVTAFKIGNLEPQFRISHYIIHRHECQSWNGKEIFYLHISANLYINTDRASIKALGAIFPVVLALYSVVIT